MGIYVNSINMCVDIIIIAILIILLDTKIVANKYLAFCRFLIIIWCLVLFSFFMSDKSEGVKEKNATSDPEINPEHITSIIQDIKSI